MRFPGWRAASIALVVAGLAVPLTATAASASPRHDLSPQSFTLVFSPRAQNGDVNARGPVHGQGGTDNQTSNTTDFFVFNHGNSVKVRHTDVSNVPARINWRNCTAAGFANGRWTFDGGTGRYANATGFGHFTFAEFYKLDRTRSGRCDPNPDHAKSFLIVVNGSGVASAGNGH
jgi:hypothetical protein